MKQKMKKLSAVLMAVAMVLSLSVTAFAGATTPDHIPSQPYDGATDEITFTPDASNTLSQGGSTQGSSVSEGPLPGDPIEIILPTVTPAAPSKMGVFDMILDPHNMIKKTEGARYEESGKTKTFAPVAAESEEGEEAEDELNETDAAYPKLYFATEVDATAGTELYSGVSQTLKIINKSHKEVNVDLSLDFAYPEDVVHLVESEDELQNDPEGLNEGGAQMYLALVRGSGDDEDIKPVKALPVDDATTATVDESEVPPTIWVDGDGDYLAQGGVAFAWGAGANDDIKSTVGDLTFTLSYAAPDVHEVTAAEAAADTNLTEGQEIPVPATITVNGTWTDPATPSTYTYVVEGDEIDTDGTFDATTGTATITATVKDSSAADAATLATATFTVVKPNYRTMDESETQVVHFKAPVAGATIQTAIGFHPNAYTYAVWDGQGTKPQGTTATGYYWQQASSDEISDEEYPFVTFKLVGNINNDLAWDQITANNTEISFELVWNVLQRSTYNDDIDLAQELEVEGGDEPHEVTGDYPTVTVTKMTSTVKNLTITWTPGTEDRAAYVPSGTVTTSNGKTLNMTVNESAHTLYLASAYSTVATNGATATVTFTADGLEPYTVTTTALR